MGKRTRHIIQEREREERYLKQAPIIFRRSLFCFQCLSLTSSLSSIRNSYFKFKLDSFELKFSPSFVVLVMMIVNSYSRWRIAWMLLGMSNFSKFSCRFLNNTYFFSNLNSVCSNVLNLRNLKDQIKKAFCFKHWTDISLLEQSIIVISKCLQLLGLHPLISKVFLHQKNNSFSW